MNRESSTECRAHILKAIEELSAALLASPRGSDATEFGEIGELIGDAIGKLDNILRERVYRQHPELDDLSS
jgi:hypothetical protein